MYQERLRLGLSSTSAAMLFFARTSSSVTTHIDVAILHRTKLEYGDPTTS